MGVDGHLRTPRERRVDCGGVCVGVFDVASHRQETGGDPCGIKKERKYSQKLQRVGIFAFVKLSGKKKIKKDLISPRPFFKHVAWQQSQFAEQCLQSGLEVKRLLVSLRRDYSHTFSEKQYEDCYQLVKSIQEFSQWLRAGFDEHNMATEWLLHFLSTKTKCASSPGCCAPQAHQVQRLFLPSVIFVGFFF